ncbi:MAG: amidohydrolase family protein [Cyanobacteria bacterium J06648_16]
MSIYHSDSSAKGIKLIRGRWIFAPDRVIPDGAVAVENETILAVGEWETLHSECPRAEVLGSTHHAVLPGLINAHHHSNGVPNSLMGIEDDFLELWLFSLIGLRSQPTDLKTLFSIAALLKTGVTTVLDFAVVGGSLESSRADLGDRFKAYEQAGLRVAMTPGCRYESLLVHNEDQAFLASLPADLQQRVQARVPLQQTLLPEDYLALISDAVQRYKDHPHIDVWFGPPGPQWVGDDLLVKIVETAQSLGTGVQTHALESFYEKLIGPRFHGRSVIAHLKDLGVLSPQFSIAHGVWVTDSDIEILAETGASISHNPSSNLRLRAGVAPLNALLAGGVTVGLGMDGTTINDDEDMFNEMRLAARLHRTPQIDEPAPSFSDILRLATAGGAKLLGKEAMIGTLAPGYRADMALVKCDRITWPWVAPEADPLTVMMMRARAGDVDTVLVNGKVVLKAGQPTGFDLPAVAEEMATHLEQADNREAYRALSQAVRPHLAQWYAQWDADPLSPFDSFNSRR